MLERDTCVWLYVCEWQTKTPKDRSFQFTVQLNICATAAGGRSFLNKTTSHLFLNSKYWKLLLTEKAVFSLPCSCCGKEGGGALPHLFQGNTLHSWCGLYRMPTPWQNSNHPKFPVCPFVDSDPKVTKIPREKCVFSECILAVVAWLVAAVKWNCLQRNLLSARPKTSLWLLWLLVDCCGRL